MDNSLSTSLYFLFCFFFLFAQSCGSPQGETSNSQDKTKAFFVSNPQIVEKQDVPVLETGADAPSFRLPGADGKFHSLEDFNEKKILAVLFTCNHCPTAQAYESRVIDLVNDYKDKDFALVAISPNSPLGLLYEELGYSDLNDDFAEMSIRAEDQGFNFPYLYDGDDQKVSLAYGPVATPHVFLFDKERKLIYNGRLDKIERPGQANAEDLRAAIDAALNDQTIEEPETKTFGCSTKWGWKLDMKEKVEQEWAKKEVSLQTLVSEEVKKLIANEDSNNLRLVNVWATWCGPCTLEYPDFIVLQRMFGARDFEFVSISADDLKNKDKVLKFLTKSQSALPNYQFDGKDKYELIEAIDKDWNGALPYTMLIEPGGNVVWKHQGHVDFYELKKVIVEHEMIGRYF